MNARWAWGLAVVVGCAGAPPAGARAAGDEGAWSEPTDAGASIREGELRWLAAHLADDADPTQTGVSPAVHRLVGYGAAGVRVVAEVFRAGDDRRAPYARSVVERVMRAHCHRDVTRIARTRRWLFDAAVDASVATWPEGSRWPLERVARLRDWADREAPCESAPTDDDAGS